MQELLIEVIVLCLYSCHIYSFIISHAILYATTACGFAFAQAKGVVTDPALAVRAVSWLISLAFVGFWFVRFYMIVVDDAYGRCYRDDDCDVREEGLKPQNKLAAMGMIVSGYFLCECACKMFQLYEIKVVYNLPLTNWHLSTGMFDSLVFFTSILKGESLP